MISDERRVETASSRAKRRTWNIAGALLAVLLVWLVLRGADWRAVAAAMRSANIWALLFAWLFAGGSSWLLRAARWRLLLIVETPLRFWPVFWANSAGNLGNNLLPARAGELIRAAMVGAGSGLTQRFILATAACERVLDLLMFVTLAEIAVWFGPDIPAPIVHAIHTTFLMAIGGVGALIFLSRSQSLVHLLVARGLRQHNIADRIRNHLEPVVAGVRSIHSLNRLLGFVVLSALIWLLDVSGAKLVAYAMGLQLSFSLVFVLMAGLVFISLIPATPGQLGLYQWVVIRVLATSHVNYNQALTYSFVLQAGGYVVLGAFGVVGLMLYTRSRSRVAGLAGNTTSEMENSPEWVQHQP